MWNRLLALILGYLAPFIAAFVINFEKASRDNPAIMNIAYDIVIRIARTNPEWTGQQKRDYGLSLLSDYIREIGKDIGESLQRAILELAVQRAKKEGVA